MSRSFNLGEILRIAAKANEVGRDNLEPEEREELAAFDEVAREWLKGSEVSHPETDAGFRMWEELPPEKREQFADWTPRQFYAMKLLIDELDDKS